MMRVTVALVLSLSILVPAHAGDRPKETLGKPNGRWWNSATKLERETHLKGMFDGLFLAARYTCARDEYRALLPEGSYLDISAAMTAFYADSANEAIPLESVWVYLAAKKNGATPEQLAEMVREWRRLLVNR